MPEALTCDLMHTEFLGEALKHFTLFMRRYAPHTVDAWRKFCVTCGTLLKEQKKGISMKFQSEKSF